MYDAWRDLPGIEYPKDGSEGKAGIFWIPSSQDPRTETRSYARTGHYDRVQPRDNYAIITGHKVVKINFSQHHKSLTATSVKITSRTDNSSVTTITAKKEIILAAGTIHTPQILQLSGIGPRSVLKSANISQVLELPGVGSNFHDHSWFAMGFQCKPPTSKSIAWCPMLMRVVQTPVLPNRQSLVNNKTFGDWALNLWETNRTGEFLCGKIVYF
jgi:choline dehydrogenase